MPEDVTQFHFTPLEAGATFRTLEEPSIRAAQNARFEEIDTVVVGAGQAGLSVSYHLRRCGVEHIVLEAAPRVGDVWRRRWDSLRLFTPARFTGLDGMPFPSGKNYLPTKDEMADYLEAYAARYSLPVRTGVRVTGLTGDNGRYVIEVGSGGRIAARNVVIAAASMQAPRRPSIAKDLDPSVLQFDARDYRNPEQLAPGQVLIVGAGNSGSEIAADVAGHHEVLLSGNDPGELPLPFESWILRNVMMPVLFRLLFHRILTTSTPMGRKAMAHHIAHSHPLVRVRRKHLAAAGVQFLPRLSSVRDGKAVFEDGSTVSPSTVIWCTGYTPGLDWVKLPVLDGTGRPLQWRGSIKGRPGLYVVGLHFQRAASSVMIHGVGADAAIVARDVAKRSASRAR